MAWPRSAQRALILLAALALAAAAGKLRRPPPPELRPAGDDPRLELLVDLNAATAAELESVPGIGGALARRILAERARRGRLASVEELLAAPGDGPNTLAALRTCLEVR